MVASNAIRKRLTDHLVLKGSMVMGGADGKPLGAGLRPCLLSLTEAHPARR